MGERPADAPPLATLDSFEPVDTREDVPLEFTAEDGRPPGENIEALPTPETKPLNESQIQALFKRLPDLKSELADKKAFAKRPASTPPPKTGTTVVGEFPPASDRERPTDVEVDKDEPLKVLRYQPEGDIPIAPKVSVTFNLPMVAVTSHTDTVKDGVPVKMDPMPEGQWRWVGAKTLLFESFGERMPMATDYKVTIPADTKAMTGNALDKETTFTFSTPAVTVESFYPEYGTYALEQPVFLQFDQAINRTDILEHIEVRAGAKIIPMRLATAKSLEAFPEFENLGKDVPENRWLIIEPTEPYPYNTTVQTTLKVGAPSAEGPKRTTSTQQTAFQTYGPLRITEHRCGWQGCRPHDTFSFRLSNQLDPEKWDDSMVKVEPSYPDMVVHQNGNWISIGGMKPGRRKYTVTFSTDVEDEFGQKLEGERRYTFDVGAALPALTATSGQFVVLDPAAGPKYTVFSTNYKNVRLKAWQVTESDWRDYLLYAEDWRHWGKKSVKPPGRLVFDGAIKLNFKADELVQTDIDLTKQFGKGRHLVVEILPGDPDKSAEAVHNRYQPEFRTWIHRTNIGLDAFMDNEEFTGWATDLTTGKPLQGVTISLPGSNAKGVTGADGTVTFALPAASSELTGIMVGTKGDDTSFLPEVFYSRGTSQFYKKNYGSQMRWMVFDDRGMYKPSEEVHIKGFVRNIEMEKGGDMSLVSGSPKFDWTVYDAQNVELAKGQTETTALGGFDLKFKLPDTPNLGYARIEFRNYGYHTHSFQIQEFRTPEFEVSARAPEGPHLMDAEASATVSANYYAGGALTNAEVNWSIQATESSYTPPNQSKYSFGMWTPWWRAYNQSGGNTTYQSLSAKTDAAGEHTVQLKFGKKLPPKPMSVKASATVMDVNRQAWTSATNLLVHPSLFYVGMRSERYFVEQGEPLEVKLVVSDIDGNLTANRPVKVRASRVKYSWKNGEYVEELADTQECDFTSSEAEHTCTFKSDVGGTYKIAATTVDDYGRPNYTEITRWVSGGKVPLSRKVTMEEATLIPDKEVYAVGDTAEILVQSPFVPAEGIMTIRRQGIVEQKRFTMTESTTVLNVPLKSAYIPNVFVGVDLVGAAPRLDARGEPDTKLPKRPAIASGMLAIKVPPTERILDVQIKPSATRVAPGTKTSVALEVKDANGNPVKDAEVAIVVVDEAVLALSSYAMQDPMAIFYADRADGMQALHQRPYVELVDPAALQPVEEAPMGSSADKGSREMMKKSAPRRARAEAPMEEAAAPAPMAMAMADSEMEMDEGAPADVGGASDAPIAARTNFNPLALFAPAKRTDASGRISVDVQMPDNLTRYRIMAVAVQGANKFGTSESNVTARLPVMVRPSAPRFLNFGDKFELPIVVQNQTDDPMTVFVATRASNLTYTAGQGLSVQVPANERVEVRFPATTQEAGTARFQVGVSADTKVGNFSDAAEIALPVWTPATSEAFATYGEIDKGAIAQPVKFPEEVWPQFGELEVTTSSTALQSLTDAFLYLYHYDYECAEQISSRMISVAALRDVLTAFKAEGMPSAAEVQKSMSRDIEELVDRQNYDGGFGFWRRGQPSWPYVSLHAAHALQRAKMKGYAVPDQALQRAKNHLQNIENYIPHYYGEWTRLHIISYSLYVRGLMGEYDTAKAREVMRRAGKLEDLSFESVGWLLGVFANKEKGAPEVAEIRRFLNNRVTETAGNAHFAAAMNDGHHLILHSDRRADGVILEALMDDQPKTDLVPKIVKGLMAHRKKGRWGNTQENAFVLLALDKYFNIYEKETPDFVARVWLGDQFAGEHKFKGRTTEQHEIDIPMSFVAEHVKDTTNLYLQKDGKGRLYYRIGMNYAPKSLFVDAADHGFTVERTYEGMDSPHDVKLRPDGVWEVRAGARVKIKLTMVAETRRYHVALVDPIPAGFETLNPALATTEDLPQDQAMNSGRGGFHWWWWSRPWFEHQNMRDERTEAYTSLLWGGVHEYTYYARATTPGEFVVPPTKAEEMYSPETFGRSASARVVVK